jgi:hypothetical protein
MKGLLVVLLLVALCAAQVPTQLTYTMGQNYVYNVTGIVQNNGYDTVAGDMVPGYYSTMQAIMVMQPVAENATAYEFVMNLFNTEVSVANSTSFTAIGASGDSLGEDVYFVQMKTGQITLIEYYSDDPIYYVNVKVGAINAFQTAIVGVGSTQTVLESDPVGNHSSSITGSLGSDGVLYLIKIFNQADFTAFPDPTLTPSNMEIQATAVAGVHPEGYIVSSTQNQIAVLVDISSSSSSAKSASRVTLTNSTGLDMDLSAVGTLTVQYMPNSGQFLSRSFATKSSGYVSTNFFDFASEASATAKADAFSLDIEQAVVSMIKYQDIKLKTLTQIGNHLRYNPEDTEYLIYLLEDATLLADSTIRDRLFFVLTVAQNQELLVKYGLTSSNCDVVTRAVLAAAQIKVPRQKLISTLQRIAASDKCAVAQGSARSILSNSPAPKISGSDFPFNKSYGGSFDLGGKVAGIDFAGDLFVGTNLNCNNAQFNYEGSAEASATAVLFGQSQQAFDAQIIYGQENGSPLADAITLSVWGNQVYNQPIPTVPCEDGSYPLAHAAPGFSVEHTLWVSIIPIVFQASANLVLNLEWAWDVCPTQLSASISVTGDGQIELSGSSYTDLLLLRAGFELDGSFNAEITPEVYVQGTACTVGFEVDESNTPMNANVTSYYQWRHCKFLFFDCQWGDYNQQTWWSWNLPSKQTTLYKYTYQIAN